MIFSIGCWIDAPEPRRPAPGDRVGYRVETNYGSGVSRPTAVKPLCWSPIGPSWSRIELRWSQIGPSGSRIGPGGRELEPRLIVILILKKWKRCVDVLRKWKKYVTNISCQIRPLYMISYFPGRLILRFQRSGNFNEFWFCDRDGQE